MMKNEEQVYSLFGILLFDRPINQLPSCHSTLKKLARQKDWEKWEHGGDNKGEERLHAQLRAEWATEIFKL